MTEPMKTAREQIDEDLKLYGVAYIRNHSNGTMERLPPDEIIVRYNSNSKISREVAAERERIKNGVGELKAAIHPLDYSGAYYNAAYLKVLEVIDSL